MDNSSPNKCIQPMSIFDLLELDGDEDDDEYKPPEEEEVEDEEEEIVEDLFMGDPGQSENSDIEMSESVVADRTRSKHPITEEPKDTLEFPDVTEDLYESPKAEKDEWSLFLTSLYEANPSIFDEDDAEAKDPDYSVFDDVDELGEKENNETVIQTNLEVTPVEKIDLKTVSTSDLSKWSEFFTKEDVILLHHQMAQHVQLLTQQYLLTMTSQTLGSVAANAAFLIKEINQFSIGKEVSIFRTPNLPGALKILEDYPINPSDITVTANSWRQCRVPLIVRPIIANNPYVFQYHNLLPQSGFPDIDLRRKENTKSKTKFSIAEDHLIALGLEQFKSVDKKLVYHYIKQLLIPVKSVEQIRMHIKNKKRYINQQNEKSNGKCDENNPITYYIKNGKLLPISRPIPKPSSDYSDLTHLPEWLAQHLDPNFKPNNKTKVLPRLKLSPHKGVYALKYPSTSSSPKKETSVVLRKYRYLSKLPHIKPKPMGSLTSPEIPVINLEKTPLLSPPTIICETNQSLPLQVSHVVISEDKLPVEVSDIVTEVIQSENIEEQPSNCQDNDIQMNEDLAVFNPDNAVQNEDDDESDLAALMVASSTITSNKGRNKSHESSSISKKEAKKSLTTKHKESTILLLSEDWLLNDYNREQKEQIMVQCFVNKVRDALKSDEDYIQFLTYLNEFGKQRTAGSNGPIKDLHGKTENLLRKVNAQQVMEDFVLLLNASEAQECGKMYQYLHWRRYLGFIRKLEVYSAVEPNCIPRLHKTLTQLKASETPVNKQRLKAAVSKAISGHPYLINEFSSLFLDEKPKDYLFANDEDFDNIVITNVQDKNDQGDEHEDSFENVLVDLNDEERKYGTNECPCKICHNNVPSTISNSGSSSTVENTTSAPIRHCASCSLKFIGGKIYLQGMKKIQPAEVQYTGTRVPKVVTTTNQTEQPTPPTIEPIIIVDTIDDATNLIETESCVTVIGNDKPWSLAEDKLLLEFCKARVSIDDQANLIELFKEISVKLNRPCDNVVERFNKLMELFKHEKINQECEKNDSN